MSDAADGGAEPAPGAHSDQTDDAILRRLIAEAAADPETLGLILGGSRGAGCADAESDYDLHWVWTDEAYRRWQAEGRPLQAKRLAPGEPVMDIAYTCPERLAHLAAHPGWWTPGFADARAVFDRDGAVGAALRAIATIPDDHAAQVAAGAFDAYLNAFYRSLKAWRRGNELGGRLQAAESALHLVRALFALERRWAPYHDRLATRLDTLNAQGWPPGYLREALLNLTGGGSPRRQQELQARVEALMRARGFGHVLDAWGGDIERVKGFRFDGTGR